MAASGTVSSAIEAGRMGLSSADRRLLRFLEVSFFRSDIIVASGLIVPDKPLDLHLVYADTVNSTVDPIITLHAQDDTNCGLGTVLEVFERDRLQRPEYLLRVVQGIAPYKIDPADCSVESGAAYSFRFLPNRRIYAHSRGFA